MGLTHYQDKPKLMDGKLTLSLDNNFKKLVYDFLI
jgi:hypothetical protein